jgi:hypothetical protein
MGDTFELPPELRDRVEVLGVLGRGSFGRVLEVKVAGHPDPLALKILSPEVDMARVSRELAACERVRHSHLLTVHGHGTDGRTGWLLMERADGTLSDILRDRSRVGEAWEACRQVAAGLAALHAQGIIHRDLKPENVLMVDGVAKVGDLGLAKGGGLETLTATGLVMGTPVFMAPEQIRGEKLAPAADVFALGVILYRVAAGRMPYTSEAIRDLLPVITRGGPVTAGVPLGGCPEVVRACLDPEPGRRPEAADLARGLGPAPEVDRLPRDPHAPTLVLTSPGLARPSDPLVTPVRGVAARNVAVAGGRNLLGVVVVAGLVVGLLRSAQVSPDPRSTPEVSAPPVARSLGWPEALGADFHTRVRRDLTRAQESFLDPEGKLHHLDEVEGPIPKGWRPFLDPDPARWRLVVRKSEALGRWFRWIAEGGAFWELDAEQQGQLADLDKLFVSERQLPPFRPWLGLAAADGPPESFHVVSRSGKAVLRGEFSGWTATTLTRLQEALRVVETLKQDFRDYFREGGSERFPGAELERLGLSSVFVWKDGEKADRFLRNIAVYGDHAKWRVHLTPWLQPLATELVAVIAAARQASIREPEASLELPYVLNEILAELSPGYLSGYWSLGFELLVGREGEGEGEGTSSELLRAILWDHWGRSLKDLELYRAPDYFQERARLWAYLLRDGRVEEVRHRPWFPWLVRFSIHHGALARRPYPELAELRTRFLEVIAEFDPIAMVDIEGSLAFAAVEAGPPPGPAVARDLLARYRALDPKALSRANEEFQGLEPRLEELTRAGP